MLKFLKRLGGGSRNASAASSMKGSVADLRDKFYLEKVRVVVIVLDPRLFCRF